MRGAYLSTLTMIKADVLHFELNSFLQTKPFYGNLMDSRERERDRDRGRTMLNANNKI